MCSYSRRRLGRNRANIRAPCGLSVCKNGSTEPDARAARATKSCGDTRCAVHVEGLRRGFRGRSAAPARELDEQRWRRWLLRLADDTRVARFRVGGRARSSWRSSSSKAASRSPARWSRPGTRTGRCRSSRARVLTEDEVVVRNVPRIRDVDAMLAILEAIGVRVELARPQRAGAVRRRGPQRRGRPRAGRADPRVVPARRPAAGALPARRDATARGRRDRAPAPGPPPRRLPRDGRHDGVRARHRAERPPRPAADRRVHGRALGDGHRERPDGRRADPRARP